MTHSEKDQIAADIGKEVPPEYETDHEIPTAVVLDWCLREMGVYKK